MTPRVPWAGNPATPSPPATTRPDAPGGLVWSACHASGITEPTAPMTAAAVSTARGRQPPQRMTSPASRPTRKGARNRPAPTPVATAATPAANGGTQADTGPRRLARANEGRYGRGRPGSAPAARSRPSRYAPGRPSRSSSSIPLPLPAARIANRRRAGHRRDVHGGGLARATLADARAPGHHPHRVIVRQTARAGQPDAGSRERKLRGRLP